MTAAAPPPAAVLQRMEAAGIEVTHVYGLTETYGPATVCAWHHEWDQLADVQKACRPQGEAGRALRTARGSHASETPRLSNPYLA